MRTTLIAATGILTCLGLTGCDNFGNAPAPTAPAVQPCNCQAANVPAAPLPPPVVQHHVRHVSHDFYSEDAESGPSYSSPSPSDEQSEDRDQTQSAPAAEQNVWVDGFGRSHYAVTASAAPTPDDRARLDPWHGYDKDCDDKK